MEIVGSSVGKGGKNAPADARLVQLLLNEWLARERKTLLRVDGICGPLTRAAIENFQRASVRVTDGRIDPAGPTISALAVLHLASLEHGVKTATYAGFVPSHASIVPNEEVARSLELYWRALRQG